MKKISNIYISLFILANTVVLSLGLECLLCFPGSTVAVTVYDRSHLLFPRFFLFCIVLGIICLLALIALFILNFKAYVKYNFNPSLWVFEYIISFVLSLPMIKLWEMLFVFLHEVF